MPRRMGSLKHLHTLTRYIVSAKAERGIEQLRDLDLGGQLELYGLEHVSRAIDAEEASLSSKKNLRSIKLYWKGAGSLEVFEAMKPHNKIKILEVWDYRGQQFPIWMNDPQQLQNLVQIKLFCCVKCKELPSLGQLPLLKHLVLSAMNEVKHIINKTTWSNRELNTTLFPSLKNLEIVDMKNLEDWWEVEGTNAPILPDRQFFPYLTDLKIIQCDKLMTIPTIPSLQHLNVFACSNLISMFSFTSDEGPEHSQLQVLSVFNCQSLLHLPASLPSLRYLYIENCNSLASVPAPGSLKKLNILYLDKCDGLVSLPQGIKDLTELKISDCNGLLSLPEDLLKLDTLQLQRCNGLVSLPKGMEGLTQLKHLTISYCDGLRSLPEGLLLRLFSLMELEISGHDELIRPFKPDGEYWHLIQNIPSIRVKPSLATTADHPVRQARTHRRWWACQNH